MLKVLIADDEKNICVMIQKLIPWEYYKMEVIALVHNGIDAVKMMEEKRPDIIISDIRMPGYDGLDIVQKAHEINLVADFIIISGYKYFEYAHKALNLGVENYLLKPIDKIELENTLKKIVQKRKIDLQTAQEEAELKKQVTFSRKKMKKHFLSSIMENQRNLSDMELDYVNSEFQCEFEQGCFVAVFAKLDSEVKDQKFSGLLRMMEEIIEQDIQGDDVEFINSSVKSGIVSIVNYRTGDSEEKKTQREKTFRKMKQEVEKFKGYHITLGVGCEKNSIAGIADSIQEAVYAVKCRCKTGLDKIVYYGQLRYQNISVREILDEKAGREIRNIAELLDCERIREALQRTLNQIKIIPFYSPVVVYDYLEHVSELVLSELKNNQIDENLLSQMDEKIQEILDAYTDLEKMTYCYSELLQSYFSQIIEERRNRSHLPIRAAKQYVRENYGNQVSLEDVAEAIGLSPAYFSTMFKKEMGINFSDFLISCRMEAAKELLKTTDIPIAEVAEKVGYKDSRYFSKTFNKVEGLKPSAYRKLYL